MLPANSAHCLPSSALHIPGHPTLSQVGSLGFSPTADGETEALNTAPPMRSHHKSLPSVGRPPFGKDLLGLGGWEERDTACVRQQRCAPINREAIAAVGGARSTPAAPSLHSAESPALHRAQRGKSPGGECGRVFFVNEEHN